MRETGNKLNENIGLKPESPTPSQSSQSRQMVFHLDTMSAAEGQFFSLLGGVMCVKEYCALLFYIELVMGQLDVTIQVKGERCSYFSFWNSAKAFSYTVKDNSISQKVCSLH